MILVRLLFAVNIFHETDERKIAATKLDIYNIVLTFGDVSGGLVVRRILFFASFQTKKVKKNTGWPPKIGTFLYAL